MKTVLLVPGFRDSLKTHDYEKTIKAIEDKGYKVIFVTIKWERTTVNDWLQELLCEYKKRDPANTILAGFSFGAVTAFLAATNQNPAELWLFSLSPGPFSEDTSKSWQRDIGKNRIKAFKQLTINNFDNLAKKINCKTLIFIGEKEAKYYPELEKRAEIAVEKIKSIKLIRVPGCDHDVTDDKYIAAIEKNID